MFDHLFHSDAADAIFSDERRLQSMLDFEAALARAEARVGIIPSHAADAIAASCIASAFNLEALSLDAVQAGNLAIPMVKQLTTQVRAASPKAAGYVHFGATSQDAIDTGVVLQLRDSLRLLADLLNAICATLAALCEQYRATLMAGRTWLQHAVPITFGLKTAGWLDVFLRHRRRLYELKPRLLVVQFGGAAGTLASLGESGHRVAAALAEELQLALPTLPWHSHRDRVAEAASFHGLLMGTLGKIARDLSLLMQTEIGEVAEPSGVGRGGSSTMPHKRNPVASASILASAIRVPGLVGTMLSAMVQEQERGLGGWHAEWETLPEICRLTLGSLKKMREALDGIEVNAEAMQRNLARTDGLLLAEAVSMALAEHVGKGAAHAIVEAASERAIAAGTSLQSSIESDSQAMEHLTADQLTSLLDPSRYLGDTQRMIDSVLEAYEAELPAASRKGV